jgi:26S proteasome regulatory subunit N2
MKDVEDKTIETGGGDISPIAGMASDPPEGSSSESKTPSTKRRAEPLFERLSNFTRVTPAQLAHIVFPPESRYQPVRPVSTRTANRPSAAPLKSAAASERYAGGGGIVMMIDQRPTEEADFIENTPSSQPSAPTTATPVPLTTTGPVIREALHLELGDGPEADPPEAFEVRPRPSKPQFTLTFSLHSTLSTPSIDPSILQCMVQLRFMLFALMTIACGAL